MHSPHCACTIRQNRSCQRSQKLEDAWEKEDLSCCNSSRSTSALLSRAAKADASVRAILSRAAERRATPYAADTAFESTFSTKLVRAGLARALSPSMIEDSSISVSNEFSKKTPVWPGNGTLYGACMYRSPSALKRFGSSGAFLMASRN